MNDTLDMMRAGRVAATAAKDGTYPTLATAIEVIPCPSLAHEADACLDDWLRSEGMNPLTPERLRIVVAEFIGACVAADVDPFAVIPHLHASCSRVVGGWRDEHRRRKTTTVSPTFITARSTP